MATHPSQVGKAPRFNDDASAPVAERVAPTPAPVTVEQPRFRVWPHGSLQCDGVTFQPGEEVPLTEAQIAAYGCGCCLERILPGG